MSLHKKHSNTCGLRFYAIGIALLLALLTSFSTAMAAEWTYMVYIGGDNNLSEEALKDIEEMRQASFDGRINVLVQVELSPKYSFTPPSYLADYNTHRLFITNGQVKDVQNLGNVNMADPATLADFIYWAATNYSANRYTLTIWDHGLGWRAYSKVLSKGAVQDDTSGTFMSLAQLKNGVAASGVHLDILDFDACLMGMYEVAYEFSGLTKYLVFSEETEPGTGNPYKDILTALSANPYVSSKEVARLIVQKFVQSYDGKRTNATKSAIDMSMVPSLHFRLKTLVQLLLSNMNLYAQALENARSNAQAYSESGYIDLVSFLKGLSALQDNVGVTSRDIVSFIEQQLVVLEMHVSAGSSGGIFSVGSVEDSHGIAVFFPASTEITQDELALYKTLSINASTPNWAELITAFLQATGNIQNGHEMTKGGFALGVAWFNDTWQSGDADVDIFIFEPDGSLNAPWMGQTTTNGFFSPDSADSGDNYETYGTQPQIMKGDYLLIVNYYENGKRDHYANVYSLYMDPVAGVPFWNFTPGDYYKRMSLLHPVPQDWNDDVITGIILGLYSDWWVPYDMVRSTYTTSFEDIRNALYLAKQISTERRGKAVKKNLTRLYRFYREKTQ
ncbi:MAG: clostripain-related cysteine peptidase [Dissulfuribacterales bacterium]